MTKIENRLNIIFFLILIVLAIFYIYLAFGTDMLGEDEATYLRLGKQISEGELPLHKSGPLLKPETTPFFIPSLYAFSFILFGSSLGLAKAIIAIFGILTLLVVFLIGSRINIWFGLIAAFLLFSLPFFSHFSLISYVEIPIAFFSAMILYTFLDMDSYKKSILSGLLMGLSFFVKASGLILIIAALIYTIIFFLFKRDKKYFKFSLIAIIIGIAFSSFLIIRNIAVYNYPFIDVLDWFFVRPTIYESPSWLTEISQAISQKVYFQDYISLFGIPLFLLIIFSFSYVLTGLSNLDDKNLRLTLISFVTFFIFLILFIYQSSARGSDPRYFSIVFPQTALIGGYFLYKLKEENKYLILIALVAIVFSLYSGIITAVNTSNTSRYPQSYIEALTWINENTPEDSIIFTTYSGSVKYFAERDNVWNINEFPEIMKSTNSTYIYETLKKYDVSYILIWRSLVSQDIVVPGSNILGVFTNNFVDKVLNDKDHFDIAYQNSDNVALKLN